MWFLLMLVILLTNGMSSFGLKMIAAWGLPETVKYPYLTVWYAGGLAVIALPMLWKGMRLGKIEVVWGALAGALSIGGQVAMAVGTESGRSWTRGVSHRHRWLDFRRRPGRPADVRRAAECADRHRPGLGIHCSHTCWCELRGGPLTRRRKARKGRKEERGPGFSPRPLGGEGVRQRKDG